MNSKYSIQETNEALNRMKLLMGYDTKKTLSENKKNFIFEAGESTKSFPTSALGSDGKPKYSTDEIIQVYNNNKIKSPDGKFTYYAPSNIVINKLFDDTESAENWVSGDGSKITGSTGQLFSPQLFQEFLNIPSVYSFTNENGDEMVAQITQKRGGDPKDKYNGFYFKGYSVYNPEGEGTKNVKYNTERPNGPYNAKTDDPTDNSNLIGVEITKDKPIGFSYTSPLPPGTTITYTIKNKNTDRPLKIERVEVHPTSVQAKYLGEKEAQEWIDEITDFNFTKEEIQPNQTGLVKVSVNMSRLWNLKSLYEKAKNDRYYASSGKDNRLIIDEPNNFNYNLVIITTDGKLTCDINDAKLESRVQQLQRIVGEKFEQRLTPTLEIKTPKGFSPFCYEDFLSQLHEIITNPQDISCAFSPEFDKYFLDETGKILNKKYPRPSTLPNAANIVAMKNENKTPSKVCRTQIQTLIKKYYDEKFPTGICPEFKIKFKQQLTDAKEKLEAFENSHQFEVAEYSPDGVKIGTSKEFVYDYLTDEQKEEYKKLSSLVQGTYELYGYDNRNAFDIFIDEWLIWAQVGIGAITLICTMGGASPLLVGAATAADIIMNATVGTYQLAKGDTKEAALSFFFACLPQIHKIYGKVANIFKAEEISIQTTKNLAEKISRLDAGVLNSPQKMEQYLASGLLTQEESLIFRKSIGLSEKDFTNIFTKLEESAKTASKVPGVVKLGVTIYTDFKVIKTMQDLHDTAVKYINKYCKNCIKTEEEKRKMKTYMDNLSTSQQNIVRLYLDEIMISSILTNSEKAIITKKVVDGSEDWIIKNKAKIIEAYSVKNIPDEKIQECKNYIKERLKLLKAEQEKNIKYIYLTDKNGKILTKYSEEDFIKLNEGEGFEFGWWTYDGVNDDVWDILNDTSYFEDSILPSGTDVPKSDTTKTKIVKEF